MSMLIPWVDARLWNWARWTNGGASGGLGYSGANMEGTGGGSGYREAVMPIDADEGRVTDLAVLSLSPNLQEAVREYYLDPGPPATIAASLGIAESTLRGRRVAAHRGIAAFIGERERMAQQERARVEALIRKSA